MEIERFFCRESERAKKKDWKTLTLWVSQLLNSPARSRYAAAAAAKSLQSCPTLCDPIDSSPPGSAIPGVLQARTLEWFAISFSSACKWKAKVKLLSRVRLLATPETAAYQAPPSMGFSRQEYWSGLPLPSPRSCYSEAQSQINSAHILAFISVWLLNMSRKDEKSS